MSNFLTDLLSKLGGSGDESVIGLDIGSSAIKAVQIKRKKGKAVLETYGELSLGPYANIEVGRSTRLDTATLVGALKDLFSIKEVNITTRNGGLAIPMRSSMVSVLAFPTLNQKQLGEMVPLEARKYIPVPISEVTIDWSIVPKAMNEKSDKSKVEHTEVLVVAIHNDTLSTYSQISRDAEISKPFYEIEMFSTMRALLDQGLVAPALIVDIGSYSSKAYVIDAGVVRESHVVNRGSQDITLNIATSLSVPIDLAEKLKRNIGSNKPEEDVHITEVAGLVLDSVFSEINSVLVGFERKYGINVGSVYLTGGGAAMKGVSEKAFEHLSIKAEVGNSFAKVQIPAFLNDVLKQTGTGFSVAVGIALRALQELD